MSDQLKRYRAFISYSQKDKAYARRIHQALEGFRLPRGVEVEGIDAKSRKLGRLFRDDDEMGAATDLGAALQGAIADAENLIVVCSPNAAQSRWVNEEVLHFKRTGRADRIFAVIVGGEPNAAPGHRERECFPPALCFELAADGSLSERPAEPLGLDVRKESFDRLIVRLAAGLVRTPFDTLWKREQRRARGRAAAISFVTIAVLLVVGAAVTQGLWLPRLDSYWRYERFAQQNTREMLMTVAPGTTFQDCTSRSADCPVMVVIPEGRFVMGSASNDPENGDWNDDGLLDESPQRQIVVERFAVSRTEVTFGQYASCVAANRCRSYENQDEGWGSGNRPVINVSWDDASAYAAWLSAMTGHDYRLLTEAEWEYSARGVTTMDAPPRRFSWGNADPVCQADAPNGAAFSACDERSTRGVGSFPANAFELHDMHGNVWEWVQDCFNPYDPQQQDADAEELHVRGIPAPEDPTICYVRVIRGGSWDEAPGRLRSAEREGILPESRANSVGFRVARTV